MEDSLTHEIRRLTRHRPYTTGDTDNHDNGVNKSFPQRSHVVRSLVDSTSSSAEVRPRAPRRQAKPLALITESEAPLPVGKTDVSSASRRRKSALSVNQLLVELQRNVARSLNDCDAAKTDEIHYVNIKDKDKRASKSTASLFSKRRIPAVAEEFSIPELPCGSILIFDLLSTHGDPHYVGLMGIEVFDSDGHLLRFNGDSQIWADPADINVLAEYENDPRTVDNLVDGVNYTCDDLHAWLAPFYAGRDHFVSLKLEAPTKISMIRIWNYNKSRIHSSRGARYVEISLDDRTIFKGEIKRAMGTSHSILDYEQCCECILFTKNARILGLIERYDPMAKLLAAAVQDDALSEVHHEGIGGEYDGPFRQRATGGQASTARYYAKLVSFLEDSDGEDDPRSSQGEALGAASTYLVSGASAISASGSKRADDALNKRAQNQGGSWPTSAVSQLLPVDPLARPATGKARKASAAAAAVRASDDSPSHPGGLGGIPTQHQRRPTLEEGGKLNSRSPQSSQQSVTAATADRGSGFGDSRAADTDSLLEASNKRQLALLRPSTAAVARSQLPVRGRRIEIEILSNWGNLNYIGITGLCGLDADFEEFDLPVPTVLDCAEMTPPGAIVSSQRLTTDSRHMWTGVQPLKPEVVVLHFDLEEERELKGLRIWNFNSGSEDACRGIKHICIYLDGTVASTYLRVLRCRSVVRKAPGSVSFDYSQFLPLVSILPYSSIGGGGMGGPLGGETGLGMHDEKRTMSASLSNLRSLMPGVGGISGAGSLGSNRGAGVARQVRQQQQQQQEMPGLGDLDLGESIGDGEGQLELGDDSDEKSLSQQSLEQQSLGSLASLGSFGSVSSSYMTLDMAKFPGQQAVSAAPIEYITVSQQYETPDNPTGCMIKILFHSNHGDRFYLGLNGIELLDCNFSPIPLCKDKIQATPWPDLDSLPEIRQRGGDARRLENLANGANDTFEGANMWLTALAPGVPTALYILMDEPITIGCIRIWNYSKTSSRGAKEIEIFVDDVLVFRGSLLRSPQRSDLEKKKQLAVEARRGKHPPPGDLRDLGGGGGGGGGGSMDGDQLDWGTATAPNLSQSILFSRDPSLIASEVPRIPLPDDGVAFFDEGRHVEPEPLAPHEMRPMTSCRR